MPTDKELLEQAKKLAQQGNTPLNSKRGVYSQGSLTTGKSPTLQEHLNKNKSKEHTPEGQEVESTPEFEEGQGFWENTLRLGSRFTKSALAAANDLVGAAIDIGDWHHYIPDLENPYEGYFYESKNIPELFGRAAVGTIQALDYGSKFLDNTIGDGEHEVGNWFTRTAKEAREANELYNRVNITGSGGQAGGVGGWTEWGLNGLADTAGSIVGNLGGAGLARGLAIKGGNTALNMIAGAFVTTNATGVSIAEDVYEQTFDLSLERDKNYKQQKDLIYENAKREYLANHPEQSGSKYGDAEMYAKAKANAFKQEYLQNNTKVAEKAKQAAIIGVDTAIKVNAASMLMNLTTARMGMRGITPSRAFKGAPTKYGKFMDDYAGEMVQEVIEEAVIENLAEKKGIATGLGEEYGMSDAYNDVFSKEGLESAFWAMFGAGATTASINRGTYKSRYAQAQKAMEAIAEQDKIMKASGGATLSELTSLTRTTQEVANLVRKRNRLEKEGKTEEAQLISKQMLYHQARHAFETGTTENLEKVYNFIANDPRNSQEVKENALKAISELKTLEETYNDAHAKGYKNANSVYFNRANDLALNKQKTRLETAIATKQAQAMVAVDNAKKAGQLPSTERTFTEKVEGQMPHVKKEEVEFDIEDLDSMNLGTKVSDEEGLKLYKNFLREAKNKVQAVRELQQLKDSLSNVEQAIYENDANYNEMTSEETQRSLGYEQTLYRKLEENKADIKDAMLNDTNFEKSIDKFIEPYVKNLSKEKVKFIKDSILKQQEKLKAEKDKEITASVNQAAQQIEQQKQDTKDTTQQDNDILTDQAEMGLLDEMMSLQQEAEVQQTENIEIDDDSILGQLTDDDLQTLSASNNLMSALGDIGGDPFGSKDPSLLSDEDIMQSEVEKDTGVTNKTDDPFGSIPPPANLEDVDVSAEGLDVEDTLDDITGGMLDPLEMKDDVPQQQLNAIQQGLAEYKEVLDATLGRDATFEEFIQDFIKTQGKENTDKYYNAIVKAWQLNKFKDAPYKDVYNKYFKSTKEIGQKLSSLFQGVVQPIETEAELKEVVEENIEKPLNNDLVDNKPLQITNDNKPVVENKVHSGFVTSNTNPKFTFLSRPATTKVETLEDGTEVVTTEYSTEGLNENSDLDALHDLLDYDKYHEGTILESGIPYNYNDLIITIYDGTGNKLKTQKFGEWVRENNIEEGSQEWLDKVPMMHYNSDNQSVAFVTDVTWYNPVKFREDKKGDRATAIKNTRAVRQAVYQAWKNNSRAKIEITHKSTGMYEGIKIPDSKPMVTIEQANPEAKLAILGKNDKLMIDGKEFNGLLENEKFPSTTKKGRIVYNYDVRRTGTKIIDGKAVPTYTAFPVTNPKLTKEIQTTIKNAIKIYLNLQNSSLDPRSKALIENARQQVLASTGYNLSTIKGLDAFLKQHVMQFNPGKFGDAENLHKLAENNPRLKYGDVYMASEGGVIYIGVKGKKLTPDNPVVYFNPRALQGANSTKLTSIYKSTLDKLESKVFPMLTQNMSMIGLAGEQKPMVVHIADNLSVQNTGQDYDQYLKGTLKTNMASMNIGTEQEPKWISRVQPVINYKLVGQEVAVNDTPIVNENNINQGNEEVVSIEEKIQKMADDTTKGLEDVAKEVKGEVTPTISQAEIDAVKQQAIQDTNWISDDDFNIMYDPEEITEEDVAEIVKDMLQIPGLASHHQYQLVDFIFNQLSMNLSYDKAVKSSKEEVMKEVTDKLTSLLDKVRTTYITRKQILAQAQGDTEAQRLIAKYDKAIDYINNIEKNKDVIAKDGLAKILKYTGISETKAEETEYDPNNEREKNYSKTFLEEGAKDGATYELKRFLSGIQDMDVEGNPVQGFLGMPSYISFDEMFNSLQAILAGTPPDFDLMIDILEKHSIAFPFLTESVWTLDGKVLSKEEKTKLEKEPYKLAQLEQEGKIVKTLSVVDKLKAADKQTQSQFVSTMSRNKMTMEFIMYSYNKNTGEHTLKVYNSNSTGLAKTIENKWYNNFKNRGLVKSINGVYHIDKEKAEELLEEFNNFTSSKVSSVKSQTRRDIITRTNSLTKSAVLGDSTIDKRLKGELKDKGAVLIKDKDGKLFRVTLSGDKLLVRPHSVNPVQKLINGELNEEGIKILQDWLANFGVDLSPAAIEELVNKGLYHNYTKIPFRKMFETSTGENNPNLFGILAGLLQRYTADIDTSLEEEVNNPFKNSIFKSLAKLESKYNKTVTPNAFRDGGKTIQGYTISKFISDRVDKLKDPNSDIIKQLLATSFSKESMWLQMLSDGVFKEKFELTHLGINAMKEIGKKMYRDNSITSLSDADHELTKLGMFMDMQQGTSPNYSGVETRIARMFSPTMSDKTVMTLVKTAVLNLESKHFDFKPNKNDDTTTVQAKEEILDLLYRQLVKPELERIVSFHSNGSSTDVKAYDKGAGLFLMFPQMNNILWTDVNDKELKLVDMLKNNPSTFDVAWVESNLGPQIKEKLQNYLASEVANKLEVWKETGFITTNEQGFIDGFKFFDKKYMEKFNDVTDMGHKVNMAALDYIINSLVSNANSFMTMAGDPALYFKSKAEGDYVKMSKDTFSNVNKRLANQMAPGNKLADSENNQYTQIFLEDFETETTNLGFLAKVLEGKDFDTETWNKITKMPEQSPEEAKLKAETKKAFIQAKYPSLLPYIKNAGTDAQEYTTWQEHLYVLEKLGKTPDIALDITPEDIRRAREIFSDETPLESLSDKDKKIMKMVLQPVKPVYTGQIFDKEQDLMRTVYIKSSSFPLIPQMTKGLEIDKLRLAMQALEDKYKIEGTNRSERTVRASFQSANKVGALSKPISIFNGDGTIGELDADSLEASSLLLDRSNFRVQQDVPFKAGKRKEDTVTMGTQPTKLLFGDGVTELDGFVLDGQTMNGQELHQEYKTAFDKLLQHNKDSLYQELGLDPVTGQPIDIKKSARKIQQILKEEAEGRGYAKQVVESLTMDYEYDDDGNVTDVVFNLPLWMSAESNRFESLLNAIVTNRISKIKMPGNSYVVGSQEGFKQVQDFEGDKSKIVYTSKWQGELKAAEFNEDGSLRKTQVMLPSRFRDNNGNLIDLFARKGGEYTYVTQVEDGSWRLKEEMFDSQLFSNVSFRIPTSAHLSMVDVEIVGFLPYEAGDLMLVPRNLTTQIGLDFDIDKQTNYQLWHTMLEDGSFAVIDEDIDTVKEAMDLAYEFLEDVKEFSEDYANEIAELESRKEDLEDLGFIAPAILNQQILNQKKKEKKELDKVDLKDAIENYRRAKELYKKVLQNKIVKIHSSVLSNPAMQGKINQVLSIDYAKEQATKIDDAINATKDDSYFTPMSDEYQKENMFLGASGKIGIGAYSNDVVFHSLVQQNDKEIILQEDVLDKQGKKIGTRPKRIRFGDYVSDGKLGGKTSVLSHQDKIPFYKEALRELDIPEAQNIIKLLESEDYNNVKLGIILLEGQAKEDSRFKKILESKPKLGRTIPQILAERQNIATDNAKELVMARVNLNQYTLDVDKVLILLGFDKGADGDSIPFLFLSQPILKDYVKEMGNAFSNIAEFSPDKQKQVIKELKEKYNPGNFEIDKDRSDDLMTNAMFKSQLGLDSEKANGTFQAAVLDKFLELQAYGNSLREIQGTISVDSKGLGKSTFDAISKLEKLESLGENNLVSNAGSLVGDYKLVDSIPLADRPALEADGYVRVKDYYIKPTTVAGSFSVYTINAADKLWSKYFPYDSKVMNSVFAELLDAMSTSPGKKIEMQQYILQEMRKFVNSSQMNLYTLDPQAERSRLFIDSDSNQSLANYLDDLTQMVNHPMQKAINAYIKGNKLLNRFEYELNKDNNISIIKYNNAVGENFDEEQMYNGLLNLLHNPVPLPPYNGKPYNTRLLAQDLINYSLLEGGVQKAIQFSKFIPVSFLNNSNYSTVTRNLDLKDDSNSFFGIHSPKPKNMEHLMSKFSMQFAQHNPERMPKIKYDMSDPNSAILEASFSEGKQTLDALEEFIVAVDDGQKPKPFYAIYNPDIPKGSKKFQLYYFDGISYKRIPVLGTFGMDEYNAQVNHVHHSIIAPKVDSKVKKVQKAVTQPKADTTMTNVPHKIDQGNIRLAMESIARAKYAGLSDMATALLPFIDDNVKLVLTDLEGRGYGLYSAKRHAIGMDRNKLAQRGAEDTARTLVHEYVHSITVEALKKWIEFVPGTNTIKNAKENAPAYIENLVRLYNRTKTHFDSELKQVEAKLQAKQALTARERRVVYGGKDIFEFLTLATTSPEFQQEMANVKYNDKMSLRDKFLEIISQVLKGVGVQFENDSVASLAIQETFKLLEATKQEKSNTFEFNENENQSLIQKSDDLFGSLGIPTDEDIAGMMDEGDIGDITDDDLPPDLNDLIMDPIEEEKIEETINELEKTCK